MQKQFPTCWHRRPVVSCCGDFVPLTRHPHMEAAMLCDLSHAVPRSKQLCPNQMTNACTRNALTHSDCEHPFDESSSPICRASSARADHAKHVHHITRHDNQQSCTAVSCCALLIAHQGAMCGVHPGGGGATWGVLGGKQHEVGVWVDGFL